MYPIEKCEKVSLPQGNIYLGPSSEKRSDGYIELYPHASLPLHSRPVMENLTQVAGKATMIIFREKSDGIIMTMDVGDQMNIPANAWHIHANLGETTSLQNWYFDGDIRAVVEGLRALAKN